MRVRVRAGESCAEPLTPCPWMRVRAGVRVAQDVPWRCYRGVAGGVRAPALRRLRGDLVLCAAEQAFRAAGGLRLFGVRARAGAGARPS
jgi:hypothetical protein